MNTDFPDRVNGHNSEDTPEDVDLELDEHDQVLLHLKRLGRRLRVEGHRYIDERCPVCRRAEVVVSNPATEELILRCRNPLCDRSQLLAAYGLRSRSAEAEAQDLAVQRRFQELIIDHLARQRFGDWLAAAQQPPQEAV